MTVSTLDCLRPSWISPLLGARQEPPRPRQRASHPQARLSLRRHGHDPTRVVLWLLAADAAAAPVVAHRYLHSDTNIGSPLSRASANPHTRSRIPQENSTGEPQENSTGEAEAAGRDRECPVPCWQRGASSVRACAPCSARSPALTRTHAYASYACRYVSERGRLRCRAAAGVLVHGCVRARVSCDCGPPRVGSSRFSYDN